MSDLKPPPFHTEAEEYVTVDVEIDPSELEDAGWVYVGKNEALPPTEHVLDVVKRWHDFNHEGPWQFCFDPLCSELRGRPNG